MKCPAGRGEGARSRHRCSRAAGGCRYHHETRTGRIRHVSGRRQDPLTGWLPGRGGRDEPSDSNRGTTMAFTRHPAGLSISVRLATPRGARVAAALSAALILATLTGAARQPAVSYPVQAAFTPTGPYATTTGTVTDATGTAIYDLFYP